MIRLKASTEPKRLDNPTLPITDANQAPTPNITRRLSGETNAQSNLDVIKKNVSMIVTFTETRYSPIQPQHNPWVKLKST
ncbi:MAG: hypothetical protein ACJA2Q_001196 [Pseudohongiellaceae bacterium]|jgi:hypothetical protein